VKERWYIMVAGRKWSSRPTWEAADAERTRLRSYFHPGVPIHLEVLRFA
jgi:hypothetical protein